MYSAIATKDGRRGETTGLNCNIIQLFTIRGGTVTDLVQNLDEMNCVKSKDSKKYEWAATGCGVRIKLKN